MSLTPARNAPRPAALLQAALALVLMGAGALILVAQVVAWQRLGPWPRLSLVEASAYLCYATAFCPGWLLAPTRWLWLHDLLKTVPVALLLAAPGWLLWRWRPGKR